MLVKYSTVRPILSSTYSSKPQKRRKMMFKLLKSRTLRKKIRPPSPLRQKMRMKTSQLPLRQKNKKKGVAMLLLMLVIAKNKLNLKKRKMKPLKKMLLRKALRKKENW